MSAENTVGAGEPGADLDTSASSSSAASTPAPDLSHLSHLSTEDMTPEEIAAAFDSEAIASLSVGGLPAVDGEGQDDDGDAEGRSTPDALQQFIDQNYQGNRSAFVASLHESRNEARRLNGELQNLRQEMQALKQAPPDPEAEYKAATTQDQGVQSLNAELQAVVTEHKGIQTRQAEIGSLAAATKSRIDELQGQLRNPDAENAAALNAELYSQRAVLEQLKSEFGINERLKSTHATQARYIQRQLEDALSRVRDGLTARAAKARTEAQVDQRVRANFTNAFNHHVKGLSIDQTDPRWSVLHAAAKTQLADYLDSIGEDEAASFDGPDMLDAVGRLVTAYAKHFGITAKKAAAKLPTNPLFRPGSPGAPRPRQRQVLAPAGAVNGAGRPAVSPTTRSARRAATVDDVNSDPDLIRQRANAIFEAASRPRKTIA